MIIPKSRFSLVMTSTNSFEFPFNVWTLSNPFFLCDLTLLFVHLRRWWWSGLRCSQSIGRNKTGVFSKEQGQVWNQFQLRVWVNRWFSIRRRSAVHSDSQQGSPATHWSPHPSTGHLQIQEWDYNQGSAYTKVSGKHGVWRIFLCVYRSLL